MRSCRLLAVLVLALSACTSADPAAQLDQDVRAPASPGFGGGFAPAHAPYGGWGGAADCTPTRTPIVLLHGNTEAAEDWLRPDSRGGPSAVARLLAAGWQRCEVFAVTWLAPQGRSLKLLHFHDAPTADLVAGFVRDVLAYTGAAQVDLVGHSMGATVALHALDRGALWEKARRLVSIAGGLRGLASCLWIGPGSPLAPTCGSQSLIDPEVFGFYPAFNPRMEAGGFRDRPAQHPGALFYSLRAGQSDELLCPSCDSALFDDAPNVRAQLDVGMGAPLEGSHDDTSGVGHYRARRDTGQILAAMLGSACAGAGCCAEYSRRCE